MIREEIDVLHFPKVEESKSKRWFKCSYSWRRLGVPNNLGKENSLVLKERVMAAIAGHDFPVYMTLLNSCLCNTNTSTPISVGVTGSESLRIIPS